MLSKRERVTSKSFAQIFHNGKRYKGGHLDLIVYGSGGTDSPKASVVVPAKIKPKLTAVGRNRRKRQIRHLIKAKLPNIKNGLSFIVFLRHARDEGMEIIDAELEKLFSDSGSYK